MFKCIIFIIITLLLSAVTISCPNDELTLKSFKKSVSYHETQTSVTAKKFCNFWIDLTYIVGLILAMKNLISQT